jgi:hypothetical protein
MTLTREATIRLRFLYDFAASPIAIHAECDRIVKYLVAEHLTSGAGHLHSFMLEEPDYLIDPVDYPENEGSP